MDIRRIIPDSFTGANLLCGMIATYLATQSAFAWAFVFILLGAFFDFFDGLSARLLKAGNDIGVELDSLADDITFGLAPTMILACYLKMLIGWWCVLVLPMAVFSALRLAKFNLDKRQTSSFIGLATPANAIFWGSLCSMPYAICASDYMPWVMVVLSYVSCYLLISEIPFFSLKFKSLAWAENKIKYLFIAGVIILAAFCIYKSAEYGKWEFALFTGCACIIWYVVLNIVYNLSTHTKAGITAAVLLLLVSTQAQAEAIPAGYYNDCQGKSDAALIQALHDTIKGGERYHYGTHGYTFDQLCMCYTDEHYDATWSFFPKSDVRANGQIWDMYSNIKRYYPYIVGESGCALQIEHCLPKSWWGSEAACKRAYQDLYNLNPADAQANGQKSNFPPGEVVKANKFDNGSFKMDNKDDSQYGWACFEPADAYKGDFARAYFYIATAYYDVPWVSDYTDYVSNSSYLRFQPWLADLLLKWHRQDPVSQKEITRADVISSAQHNRNPFIDYPELVEYIWGNKQGQAVDFNTLVCTTSSDYIPTEEKSDLRANEGKNISANTFTASWSDMETTYNIDVYLKEYSGHNDTIINLKGVNTNKIAETGYGSANADVKSNGTLSVTMGTSTRDGVITFSGLNLQTESKLVLRASQYNTAKSAQLDIAADDVTLQSIKNLTRDEDTYEITIPTGTNNISITSVGKSTTKRACIQAIYLIKGDYKETHTSIAGYPREVNSNSQYVIVPDEHINKTVYYQISTDNQTSNEVKVQLEGEYTGIESITTNNKQSKKISDNGQIIIINGNKKYNILGQEL